MYTRFDTMRDLERTPLLSQDVVVLSEKVKSYIQRLARELAPRVSTIEKRWQRRLPSIFGEAVNGSHLRALASINPGNWSEVLAEGRMNEFLEQVEYHGRWLAKLDVPPNHVLASLQEYEKALLPDLKKFFLGFINHTHPALADFLEDFVVGDGLADHWFGKPHQFSWRLLHFEPV